MTIKSNRVVNIEINGDTPGCYAASLDNQNPAKYVIEIPEAKNRRILEAWYTPIQSMHGLNRFTFIEIAAFEKPEENLGKVELSIAGTGVDNIRMRIKIYVQYN